MEEPVENNEDDEYDVEEDEDQDTQRYIQKRKAQQEVKTTVVPKNDILDGEGCENPEDEGFR